MTSSARRSAPACWSQSAQPAKCSSSAASFGFVQLVRVGASVVEQETGGFTIHRSPSERGCSRPRPPAVTAGREATSCACQARHHRSDRQFHLLRDLTVTKIVKIVQDQRRPINFGQLVQRRLKLLRVHVRQRFRRRLGQITHGVERNAARLPIRANAVQVGVAKDAEQPWPSATGIAQLP